MPKSLNRDVILYWLYRAILIVHGIKPGSTVRYRNADGVPATGTVSSIERAWYEGAVPLRLWVESDERFDTGNAILLRFHDLLLYYDLVDQQDT